MSRSAKRDSTQGLSISRAHTLYICCCHLTVMFLVKCKDAFSSTTVNPRKDAHRHKKGALIKKGSPFCWWPPPEREPLYTWGCTSLHSPLWSLWVMQNGRAHSCKPPSWRPTREQHAWCSQSSFSSFYPFCLSFTYCCYPILLCHWRYGAVSSFN